MLEKVSDMPIVTQLVSGGMDPVPRPNSRIPFQLQLQTPDSLSEDKIRSSELLWGTHGKLVARERDRQAPMGQQQARGVLAPWLPIQGSRP